MNYALITPDLVARYLPYIGLEKLKKTGSSWNSKCPYCKRAGTKTRDRKFYILTGRGVNVYCHKCGTSKSFIAFLEDFSPATLASIKSELFLGKKTEMPTLPVIVKETPKVENDLEKKLIPLSASPDGLSYATKRKLPQSFIDKCFFADNYVEFLYKNGFMAVDLQKRSDPRIVIPYINESGEWTHIQGRSILSAEKLRYITTTVIEDAPKIWGLPNIVKSQTVYVTEGVFDAVYVKNCIAFGSAYADPKLLHDRGIKDIVFCLDHDIETNVALRKAAYKYLDMGARLFFFPKSVSSKCKDFNDLILNGWSENQIMDLIKDNTFDKLTAKVKLAMLGGI